MTREQLEKVYRSAAYIFKMSRLLDVRREAKSICVAVERYIGQLGNQPADLWEP